MLKNSFLIKATFLAAMVFISGCTSKSSSPEVAKVVRLGIWSNYVMPELLQEFEKKTGTKVEVSNYSSNEELLAKLQAGASGYDVVAPSDYMVAVMTKIGILRKLESAKIPSAKSLDSKYLKKPFDPQNEYSLPYDAGNTGIAVNRELYKGSIKGWKDLFGNADLAGKFSLLDDAHEVIGAALKSMGYSLNSKDPEQLKKAKELLIKVRPSVKAFTSETLAPLTNGEVAVAHAFVMDALQARKATGGKIDFILPEEGGTLFIDHLAIPANAAHVEEAHALINFLLEAKVEAATAERLFLAPSNREALALLPPSFQKDNPALFPSGALLARYEMMEDMGEAAPLLDRIWTDIKASDR